LKPIKTITGIDALWMINCQTAIAPKLIGN
jgi:hypothetical protein